MGKLIAQVMVRQALQRAMLIMLFERGVACCMGQLFGEAFVLDTATWHYYYYNSDQVLNLIDEEYSYELN